jgi:hypothetical protein
MSNKDLDKPVTKNELIKQLGEFAEQVLFPAMKDMFASKEDLENLEKRMDEKFATKDGLEDLEARLCTRLVTKDYLDKKLFELESRIMERVIKERKTLKEAFVLVMAIIRRGAKPTKKEMATLKILEQELAGGY